MPHIVKYHRRNASHLKNQWKRRNNDGKFLRLISQMVKGDSLQTGTNWRCSLFGIRRRKVLKNLPPFLLDNDVEEHNEYDTDVKQVGNN